MSLFKLIRDDRERDACNRRVYVEKKPQQTRMVDLEGVCGRFLNLKAIPVLLLRLQNKLTVP